MQDKKLSYPQKLLFAALLIERWSGARAFTKDDLVVAAWRCWPESFGLVGHEYPCSSRVIAKLSGGTGLVGKGLLRKVGEKGETLELTREGREAASRLCDGVIRVADAPRPFRPVKVSPTSVAYPGGRPRSPRSVSYTHRSEAGDVPPQWGSSVRPVLTIPGPQRLMGSPIARTTTSGGRGS